MGGNHQQHRWEHKLNGSWPFKAERASERAVLQELVGWNRAGRGDLRGQGSSILVSAVWWVGQAGMGFICSKKASGQGFGNGP